MPKAKGDNRRSLFLPDTVKIREIKAEATRPKSWCLPSAGDVDPYTSFRKIFHEFSNGERYDVDAAKRGDYKFLWMGDAQKNGHTLGQDDNNNEADPGFGKIRGDRMSRQHSIEISQQCQPVCRYNIFRRSCDYFKLRHFNNKNLKRESKVVGREGDKYQQIEYANRVNGNIANGKTSRSGHPSDERLSENRKTYIPSDYNKSSRSDERLVENRKTYIPTDYKSYNEGELFLSENIFGQEEATPTNEDQVSPRADVTANNISTRWTSGSSAEKNISTLLTSGSSADNQNQLVLIIPWSKRIDLMLANRRCCGDSMPSSRRGSKRYSSTRSSRSSYDENTYRSSLKRTLSNERADRYSVPALRRHNTECMKRSATSNSLKRCNSEGGSYSNRRLHHSLSFDRKAELQASQNTKISQDGKRKMVPNFFTRYQDDIREVTLSPVPISANDASKFVEIVDVFEYLLNRFLAKPVSKTCKQLFYIRSRLSKHARQNETMCDGCFGCELDC